ncbi:hypothetical protein N657DRAFT_126555 [Parathielavia appendiculata]|uniref:Uncharacterized protein n=1 Tax=Parathielavia appendiculata TaxID=2587402 RepID=A0AAN6TVB9_9PEZI|nr:hypothetical protein N657DRAFT_126555 [Parathielavia appendiculata]
MKNAGFEITMVTLDIYNDPKARLPLSSPNPHTAPNQPRPLHRALSASNKPSSSPSGSTIKRATATRVLISPHVTGSPPSATSMINRIKLNRSCLSESSKSISDSILRSLLISTNATPSEYTSKARQYRLSGLNLFDGWWLRSSSMRCRSSVIRSARTARLAWYRSGSKRSSSSDSSLRNDTKSTPFLDFGCTW